MYQEILHLPIEDPISDEVAAQLETLSEGGVNILICDSQNNLIFSAKERDNQSDIHHYVKQRKDLYSENPKAVIRNNRVDLYGMLKGDALYYIYVWQNMSGILFAALIVGLWAGRMVSLIKEIGILTRKISKGDFSKYRIKSRIPNDEFGELIQDIDAMAEMIEKYQAVNQEYITTITHDLKTPLAIIGSQVEMLGLSEDPEKKKSGTNIISIWRVQKNVNQPTESVWDFTRVKG